MPKVCLYKFSSVGNEIHGFKCDTKIVDSSEVESHLSEGWSNSPEEASDHRDDTAELTRAQLEAKADEIGLQYDKRIKDKTLFEKIKQNLTSRSA